MPILLKLISDEPIVGSEGGMVAIDVVAKGRLAERVGMSPHLAIKVGHALIAQAEAILKAPPPVVPLKRQQRQRKKAS